MRGMSPVSSHNEDEGKMRSLIRAVGAISLPLLLGMLLLGGGCGGDDDGGSDPPPVACSIENVGTNLLGPWQTGDPFYIRWDGQGAASVRIELLKAAAVVETIAASTGNDGYFAWTVSLGELPSGDDYGIRVTASDDAACSGEFNDLSFLNVAGCTFAYGTPEVPDLNAGESYVITWTSERTSGSVVLELWDYPFAAAAELIGDIAIGEPDDGSYTWDPVDSFNFGSYSSFRIRIADAGVPGCEVFSPEFTMFDQDVCELYINGILDGQIFANDDEVTLDIDQVQGSGLVNLWLYAGNEPVSGNQSIATNQPVGEYTWTVTDYDYTGANNSYRIKVIDVDDPYCVGFSERFTIE